MLSDIPNLGLAFMVSLLVSGLVIRLSRPGAMFWDDTLRTQLEHLRSASWAVAILVDSYLTPTCCLDISKWLSITQKNVFAATGDALNFAPPGGQRLVL